MNPEEGELRPQLLDRFGLAVTVAAPRDPVQRVEVVRRRLGYDADPAGFAAEWAGCEARLARRVADARHRLPDVVLPEPELRRIAGVCAAFEVDGMRADIVLARTARALAAWHGRTAVTEADVRDAAGLALPHRRRRDPFDAPDLDDGALDEALRGAAQPEDDNSGPGDDRGPGDDPGPGDDRGPDDDRGPGDDPGPGGGPGSGAGSGGASPDGAGPAETRPGNGCAGNGCADGGAEVDAPVGAGTGVAPAGQPFRARLLAVPGTGTAAEAGRRSAAYTRNGRMVGARRPGDRPERVHLPATLAAAAPHQLARGRRDRLVLHTEDLRATVHKGREGNLVLFVVDASGSMAARQRMRAVKGAVLSLLRDAYQRRDRIGLVTFRGDGATVALPPTTSHEVGAARLRELPTGGRTPLAAGLRTAAQVLATARRRDPHRRPLLVIVTDGRATSGPDPAGLAAALAGVASVVVDCESGPVRLGLAGRLAAALHARYLRLEQLSAQSLRAAATGRAA
jgi:magnesium chelatase subunit D